MTSNINLKVGATLLVKCTMTRADNGTMAKHHYKARVTKVDASWIYYDGLENVLLENTVSEHKAVGGQIAVRFFDRMVADGHYVVLSTEG